MKHKSEDYKRSAVEYFFENSNQVHTCEVFKYSERSLMRWVERYNADGHIIRQSSLREAYKVSQEHVKYALNILKKNPMITLAEVQEMVKIKFKDFSITKQHLGAVLRDNNQTFKRAKVRHKPVTRFKKPVDIDKSLVEFYKNINKHDVDDIVCIDETSISLGLHRRYCRSKIGDRCTHITNSQEVFKKYTGIFAISTKGCIAWKLYPQGGITSERLCTFLQDKILNKSKKVIILDNASSHRNPAVKELINKSSNALLYSVPYQHFTNAIELWFSQFKSYLRKESTMTYNQLLISIPQALKKIKPENYKSIIRGTYSRGIEYEKKDSRYVRPLKKYKE